MVLATHGWAAMQAALTEPPLSADPATARLLAAVDGAGHGAPVEVILFGPQPARPADAARMLAQAMDSNADLSGGLDSAGSFPAYDSMALVLWRDGESLTAGFAFAVSDAAAAEQLDSWTSAIGDAPALARMFAAAPMTTVPGEGGATVLWTLDETPRVVNGVPLPADWRNLLRFTFRRGAEVLFGR